MAPKTPRKSQRKQGPTNDGGNNDEHADQGGGPEGAPSPAPEIAGGGVAPSPDKDSSGDGGGAPAAEGTPKSGKSRAKDKQGGSPGGFTFYDPPVFTADQFKMLTAAIKAAVEPLTDKIEALSASAAQPPAADAAGDSKIVGATPAIVSTVGSDGREYVPDVGDENPHARAVYTGGDTYVRPQRYNMHRDSTFDHLKSKPKGTLFKDYCTLEPSLRFLYNVKAYGADVVGELERGTMSNDEVLLHLDRVLNSVAGVYDLINRHVSLIHLRAQYGDNPTQREKNKLEHIEDRLTEEDFLPASLDEHIRAIARDFDDSYDAAKKTQLAKKAAGAGSRSGDDGEGESRRERAKRLEAERKAAAAAKEAAKKADAAKGKKE